MRAVILILLTVLALSGMSGGMVTPAWTAEDDALGDAGSAYCGAVARQCGLACQGGTEPGSAASAACEARCAVERAACEAQDALSGVEPWLDDKAEKLDRFMDGFEADPEADPGDPGAVPSPGERTSEACRAARDQCMSRCDARFGDDYARSGCESVCALNRATCEATAGLETARPLIEREAERLQDFFDALRGHGDTPPPPPPPLDAPDPDGDGILDI
ncbi:hypothetical protein [Roseospira visakhapatnamensis]|uniref:Uncharacterized protein n=1 Tax=Roseospira visakhapatnamensis TaxID=390880 RepID=A0A7W6W9Y2_9PROT|nr:hypothetical protein [Roseospira visakhapatnamensis]MBB4265892.1 hypothetical protein [Roseospira visakhapatnamensis]